MNSMEYCGDINVTFSFGDMDLKSLILEAIQGHCETIVNEKNKTNNHYEELHYDEKSV